tara:strand:+ start:158 stop:1342 length:1185 start_codon:yes stop_codon:yes gene_type:complete
MGGGLMQLVAYGAQDIYLTGNPQITFFKVVYRRHTNFSMEAIEQTWNGEEGTTSAARCTATISRNGDLVHRMYLEINGTVGDAKANFNASSITDIELEIGGQKIDKQTGQWMNVWYHLTEPNDSGFSGELCSTEQTGTKFQNMTGMAGAMSTTDGTQAGTITFVPLAFWFCRNPGLALPLIALQYHEVKVIFNHNFGNNSAYSAIAHNKLWADYIYLDTDERRRFAQVSHEYLIEQVQEDTLTTGAATSDLNFNHPVKELIFCKDATDGTLVTIGTAGSTVANYHLKLNGHERFAARNFKYFTRTQVYQHHTGPGGILGVDGAHDGGRLNDGIGVYSFALKPEEHQPSGTCNFSRIDNAQFIGSNAACLATKIYAVNYNVLRIMSGMGGLAYSN